MTRCGWCGKPAEDEGHWRPLMTKAAAFGLVIEPRVLCDRKCWRDVIEVTGAVKSLGPRFHEHYKDR